MLCQGRTPAPSTWTGEEVVQQVTRVLAYVVAVVVIVLGARRESPTGLYRASG